MADEPRTSPLVPHLIVWIAFLAIAIASVFTVLIPELSSTGEEDESSTGEPSFAAPHD